MSSARPGQGVVQAAEPLHEAQPVGLSPLSLGGEEHGPGRSVAGQRGQALAVQASTARPSRPAGMPKLACGVATRRSQATANWVPAPSAAPSAAATVAYGRERSRSSTAAAGR